MKVVIIDYGAGNIFSVQQAFQRLGVEAILSSDENEIRSASHVIFPGVGHARTAMDNLKKSGLDKVIPTLTQPVLGICLGMQLMCGWNEEGELNGLGIFDSRIFELKSKVQGFDKFRIAQENMGLPNDFQDLKFPHMGWNDVQMNSKSQAFYFVHGYAAEMCEHTIGFSEYPFPFSAVLKRDNFFGAQFHPEKSGESGEEFLKEFLLQKE